MMLKPVTIFTYLILIYSTAFTQTDLYMPVEYQNAYKNNTRSLDGKPGKNYWQNFSSYNIDVEVEPGTWNVTGKETITYTNNSPDSLRSIVIKTYANHYKVGAPRAKTIPLEDTTNGMIITDLKIDSTNMDLTDNPYFERHATFFKIHLYKPIAPKESIILSMNWTTQIPRVYENRIGAYDKESAFMGYWYPQIAVYDDIEGWDEFEYLGSQEFNTDYADFNVMIEVPYPYKVWATGELQNPEEVLSDEELSLYKKSKNSTDEIVIDPREETGDETGSKYIWKFKAANVKDFAAGISSNFKWISNTVKIDGRSVSSNVVYDPIDNKDAERLLGVQSAGMNFFSSKYPGVEYPYNSFTSFFGVHTFDGMEFPMIANNGLSAMESQNTDVTFHEMAHNFFPFYVGINEVKYSWMEEGWASFLTIKFFQDFYKGTKNENSELKRFLNIYNIIAGHQWDAPLITPSYFLTYRPAHGFLSYCKPAFLYFTLENLMGKEMFKKCLKEYVNRWAGKHPTAYDFMFTFNDVSKQNLNWFWKAWVFKYSYADLAVKKIGYPWVYIENVGGLPLPVTIKATYKNEKVIITEKTADIWSDGNSIAIIYVENSQDLESVEILPGKFPDIDKSNNYLELK